jgi:organic radical activating enzyme
MVFVRLSRCNLECRLEPGPRSPGGFDCDTEFESGRKVTLEELLAWVADETGAGGGVPDWLLWTGGEPGLQLDLEVCEFFRGRGWKLAVETNGSVLLPTLDPGGPVEPATADAGLTWFPFDHISVSPKVAEHAIRQRWAHEVRYVRAHGQALPRTEVKALYQYLSPAAQGDRLDPRAVAWCVNLVKSDPAWRLSVQQHKVWGVR